MPACLGPAFFHRPADEVVRGLLGKALIRCLDGNRVALTVLETEAYLGPHDLACHAARGRTVRTEAMYGPPGTLCVYFVYGVHWTLNVVTGPKDYPAAVLIRGAGHVSGPGRLTCALDIDGALNGGAAEPRTGLWFASGERTGKVVAKPRLRVPNTGSLW
jgi:DNA-3-methyladenine glycosylase